MFNNLSLYQYIEIIGAAKYRCIDKFERVKVDKRRFTDNAASFGSSPLIFLERGKHRFISKTRKRYVDI